MSPSKMEYFKMLHSFSNDKFHGYVMKIGRLNCPVHTYLILCKTPYGNLQLIMG